MEALSTYDMACSSHVGESQERRDPFPPSRSVFNKPVFPSRLVELLTAGPLQFIKPPFGAAPVTYRILITIEIQGSNSALEQCLDIMTGVKGPHVEIAHKQLGDLIGQDREVSSLRVNPESVLDVRFVQEMNKVARIEHPASVSFHTHDSLRINLAYALLDGGVTIAIQYVAVALCQIVEITAWWWSALQ